MSLDVFMKQRTHDWYNHVEEVNQAKSENEKERSISPQELVAKNPGKYPNIEHLLRMCKL